MWLGGKRSPAHHCHPPMRSCMLQHIPELAIHPLPYVNPGPKGSERVAATLPDRCWAACPWPRDEVRRREQARERQGLPGVSNGRASRSRKRLGAVELGSIHLGHRISIQDPGASLCICNNEASWC